ALIQQTGRFTLFNEAWAFNLVARQKLVAVVYGAVDQPPGQREVGFTSPFTCSLRAIPLPSLEGDNLGIRQLGLDLEACDLKGLVQRGMQNISVGRLEEARKRFKQLLAGKPKWKPHLDVVALTLVTHIDAARSEELR